MPDDLSSLRCPSAPSLADAADEDTAAAAAATSGGGGKALASGPVLLADADTRQLLTQQLKSGRDLIQTPFGNLPQISEKVTEGAAALLLMAAPPLGCMSAVSGDEHVLPATSTAPVPYSAAGAAAYHILLHTYSRCC
jgi:hypothetical protein